MNIFSFILGLLLIILSFMALVYSISVGYEIKKLEEENEKLKSKEDK